LIEIQRMNGQYDNIHKNVITMMDSKIDWLTVLCPAQKCFTYTETSPLLVKGCKIFGLSSTLRAFEHGGIFIVPHLLWHWTSVSVVSSEGPAPFSRLLGHTRGCGGFILIHILTGLDSKKYVRKCLTWMLSNLG
jgi:hypothetical protein